MLALHYVTALNNDARLIFLNFEWTQNVTVIKAAHWRRQQIMCLVKQAARKIYNTSIHWPSVPSASIRVINCYLLTSCADRNSRLVAAQEKYAIHLLPTTVSPAHPKLLTTLWASGGRKGDNHHHCRTNSPISAQHLNGWERDSSTLVSTRNSADISS